MKMWFLKPFTKTLALMSDGQQAWAGWWEEIQLHCVWIVHPLGRTQRFKDHRITLNPRFSLGNAEGFHNVVSAREEHTSGQSGGSTPGERMPLNKEFEGWCLLFERHFREWRVTLGLDNSTHNRTRAELAFVWEVIQNTAVLFVYSRRLASMVGVYASQKLAKDIIWDLGGKIRGLLFILPKNMRKRFSFLACMERLVLKPFLVCMSNTLVSWTVWKLSWVGHWVPQSGREEGPLFLLFCLLSEYFKV